MSARWGQPTALRLDNGFPWGSASDFPPGLALWLLGLGADLVWRPPRHKHGNAVVERAHGVCQRWVEPGACRGAAELQTRLDYFSTSPQRTNYSPILYDIVDFSNALFDPEANLVGQTTNVPVHLASMHFSVPASLAAFPDGLEEGDVVFRNDPCQGGTHIPDVTFTMPVVVAGETIGFAASRGHGLDHGGAAPGGITAWHSDERRISAPPKRCCR